LFQRIFILWELKTLCPWKTAICTARKEYVIIEMIKWIFDGIGTEIISLIVGLAMGGFAGYKIGIKHTSEQKQVADDSSKQRQELYIDEKSKTGTDSSKMQSSIKQSQKAGKNAEQSQVGGIKDGRR
jgi:hypothetical protein